MRQYQTVPNDTVYTEKELNNILQSESFELTVRALANRNPFYARTMFKKHYSVSLVYQLCNIASSVSAYFYLEVLGDGWSSLEEYEKAHYSEFHIFQDEFYGMYAMDDEPTPLDYSDVIEVLEKAKIGLTEDQKHAIFAHVGPFTEEEHQALLKKCREVIELFGWNNQNGEPIYKE